MRTTLVLFLTSIVALGVGLQAGVWAGFVVMVLGGGLEGLHLVEYIKLRQEHRAQIEELRDELGDKLDQIEDELETVEKNLREDALRSHEHPGGSLSGKPKPDDLTLGGGKR